MKKPKLTKAEKKIYFYCCGHCSVCLYEGGCKLEKKLKKIGLRR